MIGSLTAEDRATSLRQAAHKLDVALLALEAFDLRHAGQPADPQRASDRRLLVDVAAQICWEYVVQREMNGVDDHGDLRQRYRVPDEVWQRIGASPRPE